MKKAFFLIPIILTFVLVLSTQSCFYDNEQDLYPTSTTTPTNCDTTNAKFAAFASPLIVSKCGISGCHNAASSSAGANLSTYTSIKAYITSNKAAFLGSIKHTSSYSSMPQGSTKLADCDIKKLEIWITAGMLNN